MKNAVIIFLIVVLIVTTRICIRVEARYDVLINKGHLKLVLFKFLTVYNKNFEVIGLFIKLISKRGKVEMIKIDLQDKKLKFIANLQYYIIHKIYLISFNSRLNIGNEDAIKTCAYYECATIINNIIFFKINNFEKDSEISMQIFPTIAENKLNIGLKVEFMVSLFDLAYGAMQALLEKGNFIYER